MQINPIQLKQLIEASLFVLGKPLSVKMLKETVLTDFSVSRDKIKAALEELQQDYQERGVQLVKVAGGYRFQTLEVLSPFLQPLWQEKAPKYSRATLETLAVIAYRQPVTVAILSRCVVWPLVAISLKVCQIDIGLKSLATKKSRGDPHSTPRP